MAVDGNFQEQSSVTAHAPPLSAPPLSHPAHAPHPTHTPLSAPTQPEEGAFEEERDHVLDLASKFLSRGAFSELENRIKKVYSATKQSEIQELQEEVERLQKDHADRTLAYEHAKQLLSRRNIHVIQDAIADWKKNQGSSEEKWLKYAEKILASKIYFSF